MPYPPGPGVDPSGGRPSNRKPIAVGVGLLALAAIIGGVIALTGGDNADDETAASNETERAGGSEHNDSDNDRDANTSDGPVRVVDSGFSVHPDPAGSPMGTWGVLLENTTDEALMRVPLTVTLYDSGDNVLVEQSHHALAFQPGQTIGFGDVLLDFASDDPVARIEVDIGEPENFDGLRIPADGELQVSEVTTVMDALGPTTTYTVTSTHAEELGGTAAAVHYDASGDIIGGAWAPVLGPIPANGTVNDEIRLIGPTELPPITRTEVYISIPPIP